MENVITAFYSDFNLYHFSFTSKILKLNGYDLLRSFSFLHPTLTQLSLLTLAYTADTGHMVYTVVRPHTAYTHSAYTAD